jgi:hypothetical protein
MTLPIQEYIDSRGAELRVDPQAGVIRGVKILGLASRNGRRYLPAALENAISLYEGAKVNINHPKGAPNAPRDYQERIGVLRNVAFRGEEPAGGLFGDLHYNPRHLLAEQLAWDARHAPENVGLSHNVLAVTARRGDETVVESIARVQSVDLVADPATTRGLFEQAVASEEGTDAARSKWLAELTIGDLQTHRHDLVATILETAAVETSSLRADLDRLRAEKAIAERRARLKTLLAEYELPDPDIAGPASRAIVSDELMHAALAAADDEAMRRIVESRAALVRSAREGTRPPHEARTVSREQTRIDSLLVCRDAASFVQAIRA